MQHRIVIGDVHGCADELHALLEEIQPGAEDEVIFLGDLVNRGPDPHGVFDIARSLPRMRALWGNHELRLLRYRQQKNPALLRPRDWETLSRLTLDDWDFIEHRMEGPLFLEAQNTILVHAGFLPGIPWQAQSLEVTTHIQVVGPDGKPYKRGECLKGIPWQHLWQAPPYVIYGHTPRQRIERQPWSLGIDTGCVLGGKLTACILPQKEIVQVPARKQYHARPLYA